MIGRSLRLPLVFALFAAVATAVLTAAGPSSQPGGGTATRPARLTVVCFGDSITGHRPGENYRGKYLKYSDLLELMLEGRLGLGGAEVVNSGLAGDATYPRPSDGLPGAVHRVRRDVLAHEPDIAVVLIGGNDRAGDRAERERTLRNLTSIARRIRSADVKLLMLQYAPALPDPDNPAAAWTHIDDKNPLIAEAARATGAELLDLGPALTAAASECPRTDLVNAVDGIHLNPRGEMVYARAIFEKLVELRWVPQAR